MTNFFKARSEQLVRRHKDFFARPVDRLSLLKLTFAASASALVLLGCAQTPVDSATNAPQSMMAPGMQMGGPGNTMARMDTQMKMMRETRDKMMQAKSPEERNALMAINMKQMQSGMAMMGGMGSDGMTGMQGNSPMSGDMSLRQQMMEKRMEMMQSMMQMMMDRMPQAPSK
jgi:hypothetical protein